MYVTLHDAVIAHKMETSAIKHNEVSRPFLIFTLLIKSGYCFFFFNIHWIVPSKEEEEEEKKKKNPYLRDLKITDI